jgi:3'(2'), 5'-bisphosphate nucleotidase
VTGLESERRLALIAVERAARLCRAVQAELVDGSTLTKGDRSPVTVADFGAQAVVSLTLGSTAPPIVGEERADALRATEGRALRETVVEHVRRILPETSEAAALDAIDACRDQGGPAGRRWVLDPIDGTKGYLRGGQYAIALALLEDGVPVLGVLGCPALEGAPGDGPGALFVATRGAGTQERSFERLLDDGAARRVSVDAIADPSAAVFCESVEAAHSAHDRSAEIARRLGVEAAPVRIDSQCKYAVLARGDADKLTYAGNLENLAEVEDHPRFAFVQGDIADRDLVRALFAEHRRRRSSTSPPRATSTARSTTPRAFVQTNVVGTFELLEARAATRRPGRRARARFRFLHVSTDEVYGSLGADRRSSPRRRPTPPTRPTPPPRRPPTTWCAPGTTPTACRR